MAERGAWIDFDCLQFVNRLFLSLESHEPLNVALCRIFAAVLGKIMLYTGYDRGVHVFANVISRADGTLEACELDCLYVDRISSEYLVSALELRQPPSSRSPEPGRLPRYSRIDFRKSEAPGVLESLGEALSQSTPCFPIRQSEATWRWMFSALNQRGTQHTNGSASNGIECSSDELLLLTLDRPTSSLPMGGLGALLLWSNSAQTLVVRQERVITATKIITDFVRQYFRTYHAATDQTYLPSYKLSGPRSVAILFSDIRNSTGTNEVLRNFALADEWVEFLRDYTARMSSIAHDRGGRVQAFTGDGIMAVFGEYMVTKEEAVRGAVGAANKMVVEFEALRKRFLRRGKIATFFEEKYEPLEFGIGIGINWGEVVLDYFGSGDTRVYAAVGDNVNFAQRLEGEAGRFDGERNRMRAPILVSRPVWSLSGRPGWDSLDIAVKGKPYRYRAYECREP